MILIYTHCILTVLKSSTHSWDSRYVAYGRRLKNMKISQVHWKWLSTKSKTKRSCPILVLQWPASSLMGLSVRLTLLGIFYSAIWPVSGNRLKLPQLLFRPRLLVYFENYFFYDCFDLWVSTSFSLFSVPRCEYKVSESEYSIQIVSGYFIKNFPVCLPSLLTTFHCSSRSKKKNKIKVHIFFFYINGRCGF